MTHLLSQLTRAVRLRVQILIHLEQYMSAWDTAQKIVGLVIAEYSSLRQQLADQAAGQQAAIDQAIADARAADEKRIEDLLAQLGQVLPGETPSVPVPDAGQPAELPVEAVPSDTPVTSDDVLDDPTVLDGADDGGGAADPDPAEIGSESGADDATTESTSS